jgi:formylglycine-generating enzyme required for sulfatase activity
MTVSHPMRKWVIGGALGVGLLLMCMVLFFATRVDESAVSEAPARKTAYLAGEATPTDTPAPAPTWTNTPIPPTDTPKPTATPILPTNTPEPPTSTPIPPTATQSAIENPKSEMVRVPAGEFTMGSDADVGFEACKKYYIGHESECKREWYEDEEPVHTVYLDEFYIDKYEVTNVQYRECVEAGKCTAPTECDFGEPTYNDSDKANHPVVCVNWEMSKNYCEWADKRLPTEAEWEKAARGTDGRVYPWGNEFDGSKVNFCDQNCEFDWANKEYDDGYVRTSPVGSYELGKSPYGVYDMAGNVWEWTSSEYKDYPYRTDDGREDLTRTDVLRVLRGGSWYDFAYSVRAPNRYGDNPDDTYDYLGFRCLRSP